MEASEGRETERMAKSAVQSAADTLTYFLRQKDFYLSHVDVWVMSLRNKLKALLKDVDGMGGYNESVQLIEIANNSKNVIDSFISKIAQQRGETSAGWMSYQSTFNSGIKDKPAIEDLGKKISDLKRRLDEIILPNRSQYGIHNIQPSGEASTSSTQSQIQREKRAPIVEEAEVVGFEEETRTLVGRLIARDMQRVVISITGTEGIGKTTLAKKVYDDIQVRNRFFRRWVNVHQECCQVAELLASFAWQLPGESNKEDLRGYLEQKRYLVVIDGIWCREDWDGLVTAFPDSKNGSRVLIMTRNEEVAKYADTKSTPHKLSFLNENESWTLFCKKALLGNPSPECLPNLEELGRRMVEKCGGLPPVITMLGDLLSRKEKSVYEWEKMLRSVERWQNKSQENTTSVMEILGSVESLDQSQEHALPFMFVLSYYDMPDYLKRCFLYFGAFRENFEIVVDKLIRIWIAEGFVQRRGEKEMEDVAVDYVEELISRSAIQVDERKGNGMVEKFRITNNLRDLVISRAENERFLEVYRNTVPMSSIMAARLVITSGDISDDIAPNSSTPHLLSLLDYSYESKLTKKLAMKIEGRAFKFLKVLHLKSEVLSRLHDKIGDLIELRYLCLEMPKLKYLPSTITRLSNLQTLDIQDSDMLVWLLDDIVKMEQLRHLTVERGWFSNGLQLHHLSNLQTLKRAKAGSWIEDGSEKLTNLRDLEIYEIRGGDVRMALSPSISKLVHLRSLCLETHSRSRFPAFESFSRHEHLYKMKLNGRLEKLPEPHVFPPNLTELFLGGSKLDPDPMVTLEKLPNLRSLYIYRYSFGEYGYMGKEMVCSAGGFPLLYTLTIDGFGELEKWTVKEGAMQNLRCLTSFYCKRLKMLPDGLRYISTLQELRLEGMSEELKERVRKNEGEDWFKIQHIPSLIIE